MVKNVFSFFRSAFDLFIRSDVNWYHQHQLNRRTADLIKRGFLQSKVSSTVSNSKTVQSMENLSSLSKKQINCSALNDPLPQRLLKLSSNCEEQLVLCCLHLCCYSCGYHSAHQISQLLCPHLGYSINKNGRKLKPTEP